MNEDLKCTESSKTDVYHKTTCLCMYKTEVLKTKLQNQRSLNSVYYQLMYIIISALYLQTSLQSKLRFLTNVSLFCEFQIFNQSSIIMASKYYQDGQSSTISEITQLPKKLLSLTTFIDSKMKQMANHNVLVEDLKFIKIVKGLSEHDVYFESLFANIMRKL